MGGNISAATAVAQGLVQEEAQDTQCISTIQKVEREKIAWPPAYSM